MSVDAGPAHTADSVMTLSNRQGIGRGVQNRKAQLGFRSSSRSALLQTPHAHREPRALGSTGVPEGSSQAPIGVSSVASPSMTTPLFDLRELFRAIDAERDRHGLSWEALAREVGVAASTIRRFGVADDAEADGVLALIRWLGVAPEDYVRGDAVRGNRLRGGDRYVRVDMESVARANGDPGGGRGRTRTTIQNLVEVAQRSGLPVASLTRVSET